jgi:hypothetical protein
MYVHTTHQTFVLMTEYFFGSTPPDVLRSTGDQQLGWMAMYASTSLPLVSLSSLACAFFGDAFPAFN